jgi:hypothetical protein
LVNGGYKVSGDCGVAGIGVFNGQSANRSEKNNESHVVGLLSYPFEIGSQIIEPFVKGYTGRYVVTPDQRSAGTKVRVSRSDMD